MSSLSTDSTFPTRLFLWIPENWSNAFIYLAWLLFSSRCQITLLSLCLAELGHGSMVQVSSKFMSAKIPSVPSQAGWNLRHRLSPWTYWGLFTSSKYWFPIQSTRGLSSNSSLLIINLHIFRFSFETELDWVMSVRVRMSVYRLFLPAIDGDIRKVTTG